MPRPAQGDARPRSLPQALPARSCPCSPPVRAHKRVHVQGNVDPGAACSVSLIGLEEDDLMFSIGDGETSYVLRSTQAIIRSSSVSKLDFF